jgi:WD40 repeat protein
MVATGEFGANPGHAGAVFVGNPNAPDLGQYFELAGQIDVNGAAWSADGSMLATSSPTSLMLWDSRTAGMPLFTLSPPTGRFATLAFGPQPGLLATGMSDGSAIVWQVSRRGAERILRVAGHDGEIRSVAFDLDGKRLATGSSDGLVKLWDITPAGGGETLSVAGSGGVDFSHDGHLLASGSADGHVLVYETATGKQLDDLPAHTTRVEAVHFALDGSRLVSTSSDWTVMSEVGRGTEVWKVQHDPDVAVSVAMSHDGTTVAIPVGFGKVSLVDARTGSEVSAVYASGYGYLVQFGRALAFRPDGKLLAIGGGFAGCDLIQPNGVLVTPLKTNDLEAVAFSPDGRRLVTVDSTVEGGGVRVYDITSFGRVLGTLERHFAVTGVAFSPDGSKIATIETDGTLRLWDATTYKQLTSIATDADGKVVFSPDGTRLAYTAKGEVVRVLALRIDDLIKLAQARMARSQVHD